MVDVIKVSPENKTSENNDQATELCALEWENNSKPQKDGLPCHLRKHYDFEIRETNKKTSKGSKQC